MRVMGLDVGDARIGLALSDPTGFLASPFGFVDRGPSDLADITRIAEENEVAEIVVGLPLSMSGDSGAQAGKVRGFIRELRSHTDLPIKTVDERLSTVQAQGMLRQSGRRRRDRDKGQLDAAAAAVILQAYLDYGGR
ncbi:MAG: Holliday junction resolvase RuvX [Dehalococcoidia bacterium]|nr:Holliday junction resolvase RuvX [Dehalococcoidia bacterium]